VNAFYFDRPLSCCPASVQAWDISKVLVSPIPMGFVGVQSLFTGRFTAGVFCADLFIRFAFTECFSHVVFAMFELSTEILTFAKNAKWLQLRNTR